MKTFLRVWLCLVVTLVASATACGLAATPAGTIISNTASMMYTDRNGTSQAVNSNTVAATVATVSAASVGGNEKGCAASTDSVAAQHPFTRSFPVTNDGNITDSYTINAATTAGSVSSIAYTVPGGSPTPIANGGTLPKLAPGASVLVTITVNPGTTAVGTDIEVSLTASSTAGTGSTSTASQCAIVVTGALITGPGGPNTPIVKLVNSLPSVSAAPGAIVTYSIEFMNAGSLAATNVVVTDTVPSGILPSASGVLINGVGAPSGSVVVNGQKLTITIPSVAGGAQIVISFSATVASGDALGQTLVNTVSISSAQTSPAVSTPASVLVGTGNIVYDGLAGSSVPVAGATLSLTTSAGSPIALSGSAVPPNSTNVNPYMTGSGGTYSFGLGPKQLGPGTFILSISAPGYLNRRFGLAVTPSTSATGGTLYNVTITSLDGQLLAVAGGFTLTKTAPTLSNIYGLFGNLPMFRAQNITVTKTVDRSFASSGDRLVYTITFANIGANLGVTKVIDTLPQGVVFAPGTGRVDNVPEAPKVVGRVLTWTLPSLTTLHTIVYAAVIMPGVEENTTLTNSVTVSAAAPNDPSVLLSGQATVDTQVVAGVFTDRTVITGRVFYDIRKTGEFSPGDVGIGNVRIYLEDGESVLTDATGRYDFPGVRPGMHVLKIDVTTLPATAHPYADRNLDIDDQRSIRRLIHGVFDGGLIEDVNFALEGAP